MQTSSTDRSSPSRDPRVVLERLIAVCWRVGRRLERESREEAAPAAVRRCAIELSLLAEACGASLPSGAIVSRGPDGAESVLLGYRAALAAPLPRAVQTVLRDQLTRLERCLALEPLTRDAALGGLAGAPASLAAA